MSNTYFEDDIYESIDYTTKALAKGQYEGCSFVNCDFSNTDLSDISFAECSFKNCNLSMVKMLQTTLNDVKFSGCKMLGINYEHCNQFLFTVDFENSVLNFSSFYKRVLKKTFFRNCSLQEVDFIEADLTASVFDGCDLKDARFENTVLEKADFRTAYNYAIDPSLNKVKKARFSVEGLPGLLARYDIVVEP